MQLCAGCGEFGIFCRFHGCRVLEQWVGVLRGWIAGGLPLYSTLPLRQNNTLGQVASVRLIPANRMVRGLRFEDASVGTRVALRLSL